MNMERLSVAATSPLPLGPPSTPSSRATQHPRALPTHCLSRCSARPCRADTVEGPGNGRARQRSRGSSPPLLIGAPWKPASTVAWICCCAAVSGGDVVELLDEDGLARWLAARKPLEQLGFSTEEADKVLGKSFGWTRTPYWGEEKDRIMPQCERISETLQFLSDLGLSGADLSVVLKKFPEILGCRLEDEVRNNITILNATWGIAGNTLRNLILRNPKVLGFNVDCKGDCMAQCTRCWARF